MKYFGFGNGFLKWVKILYKNVFSKILVDGNISEPIFIKRSVRQGCPIAPLLYVCVIETLLIKIRIDQNIHGIKSPCSERENLITLYADDTGFYLRDIASVKGVLQKFNKIGKVS